MVGERVHPMVAAEFGARWHRGAQIPVRYAYDGEVRFAEAATVVEDSPERLITYLQVGTPLQWSDYDEETGGFTGPWARTWRTRNVLKIYEPGAWCAIWCMWLAESWDFRCWYVDFQAPLRRAGGGLVLKDLSLDIVAAPDLSWRWKDEDHFAKRQSISLITPVEAAGVRAEAERVLRRIETRAAPFCEPWPD